MASEGGAGLIARCHPIMVLEFSINAEAFGYTEARLRQRLADWGYRLFTVAPMPLAELGGAPAGRDFYNVLAVPWPAGSSLVAERIVQA